LPLLRLFTRLFDASVADDAIAAIGAEVPVVPDFKSAFFAFYNISGIISLFSCKN
jgi:hypothetical protein